MADYSSYVDAHRRRQESEAPRAIEAHASAQQLADAAAARIGEAYPACRIVLFGSVARRDPRAPDDIDLALYDLPSGHLFKAWALAERRGCPLEFDLVSFERLPAHLQAEVTLDGIQLWPR